MFKSFTIQKIIGWIAISFATLSLFYGPMEIYSFYLFSPVGKFYFPEFTIGSIWFGLLVIHNLAYYIVSAILYSIGIGLLQSKKWIKPLIRLYANIAFIIGTCFLLGTIPGLFQLNTEKPGMYTLLPFISLVIIVGSLILRWAGKKLPKSSSRFDQNNNLIISINFLMIIFLHILTFFGWLYPWFGQILTYRQSIYLIPGTIVFLVLNTYFIFQKKKASYWLTLLFSSLAIVSILTSFRMQNLSTFIGMLNISAYEQENLISPLQAFLNYDPVISILSLLIIQAGLTIKKLKQINLN